LEQAAGGALASWLGHQPEIDEDDRQSRALLALMEETSAELLEALSGVPAARFETLLNGHKENKNTNAQKKALLSAQAWWPQEKAELSTAADWSYVAATQEQLSLALRRHRQLLPHSGGGVNTIHLCAAGETFWLDLRKEDKNLRFVGHGAPLVRLDPRRYIPLLDLKQQQLHFEKLELLCQPGTEFSGWQENTRNCRLAGSNGAAEEVTP
ncbi:MAG: hypothetical protein IIV90_07935, partial [Oscillospiraceae bacterium]|nr:hypothetical protein [Oscillospiraceae bacterium]